ncbi:MULTISPECIES: peptide deformylase [unclassified Persephonella]|uniref:peptide deformylase n=1 Tax=unclassified Persephonella TaxID=2641955 RepID=UPI0004965A30|nr:peptide deformylase [Persephonella sp. KM09-Lau-8]
MEKLEILRYPDERLKKPSIEVVDFGKEFKEFVDKLLYTMKNSPAGVGIAAPQVNKHIKTIIVDASEYKHKHNKLNHGLMILSNPRIIAHDGEIVIREGCLSVPDYTGNVKRHYWIKVEAEDINGNTITFDTEGFEAVVIQHEMDHLIGKLFIDRVASPKDIFKRKVYKK